MRSPSAYVHSCMRSPTAFMTSHGFADSEFGMINVSREETRHDSMLCLSPLDAYLQGLDFHGFGLVALTESDQQEVTSVDSLDTTVSAQAVLAGQVWQLSRDAQGC